MTASTSRPARIRTLRRTTLATCLAAMFALAGSTGIDAADTAPTLRANKRVLPAPNGPSRVVSPRWRNRALDNASRTRSAPTRPATTLTVTNCDDAGPGSLRDLVASAVDGDIIDMQSLTCSTISLTGGKVQTAYDISLVGPGENALTIDGNNNGYVLETYGSLSIEGVTIANGSSSDGFGGCVSVMQDLTLRNSTITGCRAGDGTNSAAYGAGVNVRGDLSMQSSTISNSHAEAHEYSFGGGAYVGGVAFILDSTISTSSSSAQIDAAYGGGIFAGDVVFMGGSQVLDNGVSSADGIAYGGGIESRVGVFVLAKSTISGNAAHSDAAWSYGGGINISGIDGGVILANSAITGNSVTANCDYCYISGGGVRVTGQINVYDSAITDNHVISSSASSGKASGGGLFTWPGNSDGTQILVNSTVSGNSAIGGQGGYGKGGGLYAYDSPVGLYNSTVTSNHASTSGGGAVVGTGGTYDSRFESSIVAGNEAPINADVASFLDSVITIDGSHNMIRSWSPRITLPFDTSNADPQLLPLADNGGFTKTHAIAECSPAIDAGLNGDSLDWDQRGEPYTRESGAGTDIGAFEYQFYFPDGYIFRDGFEAPRCP